MCDTCSATEFVEMLEGKLDEHDYGQVTPFLESVLVFAQENDHVTDEQKRGVQNCLDAKERWR